MIFLSMAIYAVVSFQWFFWGFSLAFAPDASRFIGTLTNFGFMNVDIQPSIGSPKVCLIILFLFLYTFLAIMTSTSSSGLIPAPLGWSKQESLTLMFFAVWLCSFNRYRAWLTPSIR